MLAFDPSTYLQEVLKPYTGGSELPGLFERYCLEVSDADDRAIEARLREVKALWDKRSEHPKYGEMIRSLLDRHAEALLTLADAGERETVARKAREESDARVAAGAAALKRWEDLVDEVVRAQGGLDPSKRAMLEKAASSAGVDAAHAKRRLDRAPVAAMPEVLDDGRRADIRNALAGLARESGERRVGLSLFHALGLGQIKLDAGELSARHRAMSEENAKRSHGNAKTAYGTTLALVKLHLLDSDPRAYVAGLQRDVGEVLAADVIRAGASDGEIDEMEAQQLTRQAFDLGLTQELAEGMLLALAREHGLLLRTGAKVDYIACPSCNAPHPRADAPAECRRCETPLFVICPADGCGTRNDATAGRCTKCGVDLYRHVAALKRLAGVTELIGAGRVHQAEAELAEAQRVLGDLAEVRRARAEVEAALANARAGWASVTAAREAHRLYTARQMLRALARSASDVPGPDGTSAADQLTWVQGRLEEVDAALESARSATGSAREAALSRALDIAADCTEAETELGRIPPRPIARVDVAVDDAGIVISFAPSPTPGVRYEIMRTGASGAGGEPVGTTEATRIDDKTADAGAIVRYAVTVLRGARRSEPILSERVLIAREVSDLKVLDSDASVRLSWQPIGVGARVLVERTAEGERIPAMLTPDAGGLTDPAVRNGQRYRYRVLVEYAGLDGRPLRTAGRTVFGQPASRPEPITGLDLRPERDGISIRFAAPPTGSVTILRCSKEPDIEPGSELDAAQMARIGVMLPTDGTGARDRGEGVGTRWYLPVTMAGGLAIAGHAVLHVALPAITDVQAVESAGSVRVTWAWPDGVRIALVVWRRDRQPDGPDDPLAERRSWRLGEYRDQGGFSIHAPGADPVFIAVFAATRLDGELAWSSVAPRSARAGVVRTARRDLRYEVRRGGLRKRRLDVEITDPPEALPALVLIARRGDMLPRNAADGEVLAELGGGRPPTATVELGGRERPLAVRMFVSVASEAGSYRVHDPLVDSLVIR